MLAALAWVLLLAQNGAVAADDTPPAEPVPAEPAPAEATKKEKARALFIDPEDHAFDMSGVLAHPGGFLPVPVPITEPAVGYGAFVGGVFFVPPKNPDPEHPVPSSLAVAGGALTTNGTWAALAAYLGYWRRDTIRYFGAAGYGDIGLTWYGTGDAAIDPIGFDLQAPMLVQQILFRLGRSKMFLGARYAFAWVRAKPDTGESIPGVDEEELDSRIGALGLLGQLDSRDNTLSPSDGLFLQASVNLAHPWLGATETFGRLHAEAQIHQEPMTRLVFGLRVLFATVIGDEAPFYVQPYVQLRGVPIMRYVGAYTISAEAEMRWDFWRRWSLVPFGGFGAAVSERALSGGSVAWGAGLGARYLIARRYGLRMGIDVAHGPEQFAFYVVMGSAWLRP